MKATEHHRASVALRAINKDLKRPMSGTPQAFTVEEAIACKGDRFKQIRFIANLLSRGVWQGARTSFVLEDAWDVGPDLMMQHLRSAKDLIHLSVEDNAEELAKEVMLSFRTVRTEAFKQYEALTVNKHPESKTAQRYLETALKAATAIRELLPKDKRDEDNEVVLRVELGSGEKPKDK